MTLVFLSEVSWFDHLWIPLCSFRWHHVIFTAERYSTVSMNHIFTHSSLDGRMGCFHILGIVNSATVNIGGAFLLSGPVFLWIYAQEWDWQFSWHFEADQ